MFATAGREGKFQMRNMNPITFLLFSTLGEMMVDTFMSDKSVQQLLKSNQKFDLVIGECFLTEGLLGGFAHKYNAPIAAIGTFLPNTWTNEMVSDDLPSVIFVLNLVFSFYKQAVALVDRKSGTRILYTGTNNSVHKSHDVLGTLH